MKSLLRVLSYLKPYSKYVYLTLFFAILTTLLDLVPPWLIKIIIDQLVEGQEVAWVYWAVGGLLLSYFGRNFANYRRIVVNNKVEQKVVFDMRSQVYRALQKLSPKYFENRSTGELMSRVNDDVNYVERIFIDGVEQVVTAALTLIGITGILFYLHWKLALLALLPIPLLWRQQIHRQGAQSVSPRPRTGGEDERDIAGFHFRNSRNPCLQPPASRNQTLQPAQSGLL